jgi:RNA polymerase sigma factor (sigma-70 family)
MSEADEATLDLLMARLSRGERAAFDPLYEELSKRSRRVARMRLDAASAADVTQSALLKVFARAHEFTPGRSVLAWFYAIVANEVRSVQRSVRAHDPIDGLSVVDDAPDAEQVALERELARALETALGELDTDAGAAIASLLGRTEVPGLAPATLRKRISRAYAQLRLLLGDLR